MDHHLPFLPVECGISCVDGAINILLAYGELE